MSDYSYAIAMFKQYQRKLEQGASASEYGIYKSYVDAGKRHLDEVQFIPGFDYDEELCFIVGYNLKVDEAIALRAVA